MTNVPKIVNERLTKTLYGYVTNMPRCSQCKHYISPSTVLSNSLPKTVSAKCALHEFSIGANSFCSVFELRKGQGAAPAKVMHALQDLTIKANANRLASKRKVSIRTDEVE